MFPTTGSTSLCLFPILLPSYNNWVKMSSLLLIWRLWLVSLPPTSLSGCPSPMSCSSLLTHKVRELWFPLNALILFVLNYTVIYAAPCSIPLYHMDSAFKWKWCVQRLNCALLPQYNRRIWAKNVRCFPSSQHRSITRFESVLGCARQYPADHKRSLTYYT